MLSVINAARPTTLISWTPPSWTKVVNTDGDLIEYSHTIGLVPNSAATGESITVTVIQRDEVVATPQQVDVKRHPMNVLVGGISLTLHHAWKLATMISDATALRPQRYIGG